MSLLLTYRILLNSWQSSHFKGVSEVYLFHSLPLCRQEETLLRVKLRSRATIWLSPSGFLSGFGVCFTSHGPLWLSDSVVLGSVAWIQLISFCFDLLPVFKFMCGGLQAVGLVKAEGTIATQEISFCFPLFLSMAQELLWAPYCAGLQSPEFFCGHAVDWQVSGGGLQASWGESTRSHLQKHCSKHDGPLHAPPSDLNCCRLPLAFSLLWQESPARDTQCHLSISPQSSLFLCSLAFSSCPIFL